MRPPISLGIDELVLDGYPDLDANVLRREIAAAIVERLGEVGAPRSDVTRPVVREPGPVASGPGSEARVARAVAQAVVGALGGGTSR